MSSTHELTALQAFVAGSVSSLTAEFCTQPLDVAKTRLMLQGQSLLEPTVIAPKYNGFLHALRVIAVNEGPHALFRGWIPAVLRQGIYSGFRLQFYHKAMEFVRERNGGGELGIAHRIGCGMVSGGAACFLTAPFEQVKVRMQAEIGGQRRYRGVVHCFQSVYQNGGVRSLFRGSGPSVYRASFGNAAELASYDTAKKAFLAKGQEDNVILHAQCSLIAGFVSASITNPIDVIKTRLMNSGPADYTGTLDCFYKTVQKEGPLSLYRGFVPNFVRLGPWCFIMFVTYEQIKKMY